MATVIDCVGHPSGAHVRDAGYSGIALYVGTPGRAKAPSRAQVADYRAQGLELVLVYEDNVGTWAGGRDRGAADARAALQHLQDLGIDWSRAGCLYLALDTDITDAGLPAARAYMQGAAEVLGGAHRVGAYGGRRPLADLLDRGLIRYAWSAAGWQYGHIDPRSHLQQKARTVMVGGVAADLNTILAEDFGQYPSPAAPAPEPAPAPAEARRTSPEETVASTAWPATIQPVDPASGGRWQDQDPAQWPRSAEVGWAIAPPFASGWRGRGALSAIVCGWAGGQDGSRRDGTIPPSGYIEYLRVFYFTDITYSEWRCMDLVSHAPLVGNRSLRGVGLPDFSTFIVARYSAPAGLHLAVEYEH
jgi:hypothetical protein